MASFGNLFDPSPTAGNFLRAAKTRTLAGAGKGRDGPLLEYLIEKERPIGAFMCIVSWERILYYLTIQEEAQYYVQH
jgi:hypothetical protein